MRLVTTPRYSPLDQPQFLQQAAELASMWRNASSQDISKLMKISDAKTQEVIRAYADWSSRSKLVVPAIDCFVGDMYSGLQAHTWDDDTRRYAHDHLLILSGLYGALRACDGILPYRHEMGYKLPNGESTYQFWGNTLTNSLSRDTNLLVNLSSVEYTKTLLPYVDTPVVTPRFMTCDSTTGEPRFVVVHAKIARGAYAAWMLTHQIEDEAQLREFDELGYRHDSHLSTPEQPVFTCETFEGTGLSVRLS